MIEIPGYYLKRTIGTGGMATVYLAVQESLDREVALKVMTPVLAADETFAARFRREARTIGQLSHPNIVQIYDVGTTSDNHNYFSMQYLPGGTLKDRLSKGMEEMEVYKVFTGVLRALGFAHELGFVHRDVKPENILFDVAGTPILTDFGIARALRSSTRITQTGMSVGTSRYMSPEQARGGTVDARSDIYSMGVVLYEALAGTPPFEAEDTFAVAYAHVNEPVPPLPGSKRDWEPVVQRALAKNPRERYPTAELFINTLEDLARRSEKAGALGRSGDRTGITRIFARTRDGRRWWQFWKRERGEERTEQVKTPLAIPSPFSRRLLARIRPWLPSVMRRPVWRAVQVIDESVTSLTRRYRKARRRGARPSVYLAGGLVLVVLAGFAWFAAVTPLGTTPDNDIVATAPDDASPASAPGDGAGASIDDSGDTPGGGNGADPPGNGQGGPSGIGDGGDAGAGTGAAEQATVTGGNPDVPVEPAPRRERNETIATLLTGAAEALEDNRLTTPPGSNALELFERVLADEPGNPEALEGLRQIVRKYLALSQGALSEEAPRRSAVFLMRAGEVVGSHDIDGDLGDALSSARRATFDQLMARGREASARGDSDAAQQDWSLAGRLIPGTDEVPEALARLEEAGATGNGNRRFRDNMAGGGQGPEMVRIPAGQFELGNDNTGRTGVTVAQPFAMSRHEVTVADFRRFVEASGYQGAQHGCEVYENRWQFYEQFNWRQPGFPQQPDHPVVCVSWNDAQAFVAWLSVQTGEGYRLPSEVEWEYALTTGTELGDVVCNFGNVGDLWLKGRFPREEAFDCADGSYYTASVGSWAPDDYGLYDMVGNVREWTLDCWNRGHRGRPDGQSAWLSGDCGERVIKGSSWLTGKPGMSPGHRLGEPVDAAYNAVGFRVVRELGTNGD